MSDKEREELTETVDEQHRRLKKYDEMQMEVKNLNESLNRCIEIVNESISNKEVNSKLDTYKIDNEVLYKKSEDIINRNMTSIEKNIEEINKKLDELKNDKKEEETS
jgi:hypothetical protein